MIAYGFRIVEALVPGKLHSEAEIHIFIISKKVLVKKSDLVK
jgi:hypothetical protein